MDDDNVTIPKSQLDELLAQNREFLSTQQQMQQQMQSMAAQMDQGYQPIVRDEADIQREIRVCFIDDVPVIGLKNRGTENRPLYIYERPDPNDPKRRIGYADVLMLGSEENPVSVEFLEFQREADSRSMKVLDVKEEPWTIEQGFVNKKEWTGSEMIETAVRVPVKVKGVTRKFKVNDPKFGEFWIDEQWVNIR